MTNPDLTPAVNLTLHQVSETDLTDAAVAQLQTRIPEWVPNEGNTETLLIEALSVIVGQDVYALNQLPSIVLSGLLDLWGVARQPGVKATGQARITMTNVDGVRTLPAGTRFRASAEDGSTVDLLTVDAQTVNPVDGLVFYPTLTAELPGSGGSGLLANSALYLVDPVSWIETAVLYTATTGGTDSEADQQYFARAAGFLRRQTSALVLADHFEEAALDVPGIGRAHAVNLWDGTGTSTDQGHITVATLTSDGTAPDSGLLADLQSSLASRAIAGLNVHVIGPHLVDYPVSVTVSALPGQDHALLQAGVLAMLKAWINPVAWPWGGMLYKNDVITRVGTFPGVARVTAVTGSSVDLAVTDPIQLPSLASTIAVTVS